MLDVYNGGNLGSSSLSTLCKDDLNKLKFVKTYFDNYFNTNVVDEFIEKSRKNMNWDWNNINDIDFYNDIQMKNPNDLLDNYFYDIFQKSNTVINSYES